MRLLKVCAMFLSLFAFTIVVVFSFSFFPVVFPPPLDAYTRCKTHVSYHLSKRDSTLDGERLSWGGSKDDSLVYRFLDRSANPKLENSLICKAFANCRETKAPMKCYFVSMHGFVYTILAKKFGHDSRVIRPSYVSYVDMVVIEEEMLSCEKIAEAEIEEGRDAYCDLVESGFTCFDPSFSNIVGGKVVDLDFCLPTSWAKFLQFCFARVRKLLIFCDTKSVKILGKIINELVEPSEFRKYLGCHGGREANTEKWVI